MHFEFTESHPSWVCGLKLASNSMTEEEYKSHPSWVCGLKLSNLVTQGIGLHVTPFVGVWIETRPCRQRKRSHDVTPFVGVWIETCCAVAAKTDTRVTPFVGVWIETFNLIRPLLF